MRTQIKLSTEICTAQIKKGFFGTGSDETLMHERANRLEKSKKMQANNK